MAILSISRDWGTDPSLVRVTTTDDLTAITTAGYLTTQQDEIEALNNGTFEWLDGDGVVITYAGGVNTFTRNAITNAFVLMNVASGGGSITVPTITDHIIVALDNAGTIGNILTNQNKTAIFNGVIQSGLPAAGNPGFFAAYPTEGSAGGRFIFQPAPNVDGADVRISNRAHESNSIVYIPDSGAPTADFLVSRFPGTQMIEAGSLEIASGDFTVTDGSIVSRISTPASGSLQLRHVSSVGDFFVLIQNKAMSQNSTYTIPDISQAQGAFVVSPTPFTQKSVARAVVAGGSVTNTIVDPFCTPDSIVSGAFVEMTNDTYIVTIVPDVGQFFVTTAIDPAGSLFSYTIVNPQVF